MIPPPFDAWVLARLLSGEAFSGELAGMTEPFRSIAERLAATSLEGRPALWDAFLAGQADRDCIIKAVADRGLVGKQPAVRPPSNVRFAYLGDLMSCQGAGRFVRLNWVVRWPLGAQQRLAEPGEGRGLSDDNESGEFPNSTCWSNGPPSIIPVTSCVTVPRAPEGKMGARIKRADKRIRYQDHAVSRMGQRGVSHDHVMQTLRHPDAERPAKSRPAKRFEKAFSARRRLIVIATEKTSEFMVISAWWN
jgi:hypothetical protein